MTTVVPKPAVKTYTKDESTAKPAYQAYTPKPVVKRDPTAPAFPESSAFMGDIAAIDLDQDFYSDDLSKSFKGISTVPFNEKVQQVLVAPIDPKDIEVKPGISPFFPKLKKTKACRWFDLFT